MAQTGLPGRGAQVKRKSDGLIGEVYASDPNRDLLTIRWVGRPGQNTLVCTSEQFFRDWYLTGAWKPIREGFAGRVPILVVVAAVIATCIYGFADFSGCASPKYPGAVLGDERTYVNGDKMHVFAVRLMGDEAEDMSAAAIDMKTVISRELKDGSADQYIDFHFLGDSEKAGILEPQGMKVGNDYGHADLSDAFDIWFKMDDLKTVDLGRLSPSELLELGHVYMVYALGTDVAGKYCDKNREISPVFCSNSLWKIWNR
jgi:hypothetical protein